MDLTTVITTLIFIGGTLLLIAYPLWRQTRTHAVIERSAQTLEEYQVRYQASLASIKDLMFDYEMGKIVPQDYEMLFAKAKAEAAQILRQLDDVSDGKITFDPAIETKIHALVIQMRDDSLSVNGNKSLLQEIDTEIERLKVTQMSYGFTSP